MREWLYNLPEWQLQLFVVGLVVAGLCILQLAFSMGSLHDLDFAPAVESTPAESVEAPEAPEGEEAPA